MIDVTVKKYAWLGALCIVLGSNWPVIAMSKSCLYGSTNSSQQCGSSAKCVLDNSSNINPCLDGNTCPGHCVPN